MPQNQSSQEPPDRQGSESDAAGWIMLGDLIANLDRPDVTAAVLTTLDPIVATRIEQRAAAAAMAVADFGARTDRGFQITQFERHDEAETRFHKLGEVTRSAADA